MVSGAWPGETVEVEITREHTRFCDGKLLRIVHAAEARRASPCVHHGLEAPACGGCPWMFVSYPAQLKAKSDRIVEALSKAKLSSDHLEIHPIVPSQEEFTYRNRAQFKSDGRSIGYVAPGSRVLAPIESCQVLTDTMQTKLNELKRQLPQDSWTPTPPHPWTFLAVDEDTNTDRIKVNQPGEFRQGNPGQNTKLKELVAQILDAHVPSTGKDSAPTGRTVLELFCGDGNLTEVLLPRFKSVVAVDLPGPAVERLKTKGHRNLKIQSADLFVLRNLKGILGQMNKVDVLVLDPPRSGFSDLAEVLKALKPKVVIYVSCDLSTYLRDAHRARKAGYLMTDLFSFDFFPQTSHIETLSILVPSQV